MQAVPMEITVFDSFDRYRSDCIQNAWLYTICYFVYDYIDCIQFWFCIQSTILYTIFFRPISGKSCNPIFYIKYQFYTIMIMIQPVSKSWHFAIQASILHGHSHHGRGCFTFYHFYHKFPQPPPIQPHSRLQTHRFQPFQPFPPFFDTAIG